MKLLLSHRVRIAWLSIVLALCAAIVVIWIVVQGAPPANSVLITSSKDAGTSASASKTTPKSEVPSGRVQQATPLPTNEHLADPTAVVSQQTPIADPNNSLTNLVPTPIITSTDEIVIPTTTPEMIEVYVSGAVQKPGVYTLSVGARITEALSAAGGPASDANLDNLNLAQRLSDEDHVAVPHIGDTPYPAISRQPSVVSAKPTPHEPQMHTPVSQSKSAPTGKININTATSQDLEALPGIGPSLAGKIVAYRQANGPFPTIEDIMQVPGIKQGLFAKVRDYITVGPP